MKKRVTIYFIVIITLVNLSSLGTIIYLRWLEKNQAPAYPENRFQLIKKELQLTPRQIEHFEKIRAEFHSGLDSLDANLEALRKEMLNQIWLAERDSQKMETVLEQISRLQVETQRRVINNLYQLKEVLTPEQSEKFYKFVSEHFPGRRGGESLRHAEARKANDTIQKDHQ